MRAHDHRLKLLVVLISTFAGICACERVTVVNQGAGAQLREVTPVGEIVWEYPYPRDDAPHVFFRANKYSEGHPVVIGLMRSAGSGHALNFRI